DRGDASVAATLGDEAPSGTKRAPHAADHVVGALHPVESRIAEHGIEFTLVVELLSVRDARIEAEPAGRFDLRGAAVDAHHVTAEVGELLGERPVAATEVENALAALWREQLDDRCPELGNEARVARVAFGIPALSVARFVVGHGAVAYLTGS